MASRTCAGGSTTSVPRRSSSCGAVCVPLTSQAENDPAARAETGVEKAPNETALGAKGKATGYAPAVLPAHGPKSLQRPRNSSRRFQLGYFNRVFANVTPG